MPAPIFHLSFPCDSFEAREIATWARENGVWGTSDTGKTFDRMVSICLRRGSGSRIVSSEEKEMEHQGSTSLEKVTTSFAEIFFEGRQPCDVNGCQSDSSFVHFSHALSSFSCAY